MKVLFTVIFLGVADSNATLSSVAVETVTFSSAAKAVAGIIVSTMHSASSTAPSFLSVRFIFNITSSFIVFLNCQPAQDFFQRKPGAVPPENAPAVGAGAGQYLQVPQAVVDVIRFRQLPDIKQDQMAVTELNVQGLAVYNVHPGNFQHTLSPHFRRFRFYIPA
ncbi:hypothetical protein [Ruminiclostridium hungatei]|uniref:hypothetical protein n=1 Tax=Ruminiclostridium hungatei TaxID=48256 RepID=UPI0013FD492F|nr:hypothetical protein [Ruminiclostridium hungatei]